jgi:Holliday junction resolvase RusA-like endonuclease
MIKSYMPPVEDGCEGAYHKGPLSVVVVLRYPYPARLSAKARTGEPLIPCDTRPDLDNLSKMILDAIGKAGVWRDDGQVASLTLQKFWSAEPGVYIQIEHIREL